MNAIDTDDPATSRREPAVHSQLMSLLEQKPASRELELAYSKRLMVVSGRANPELRPESATSSGSG
jgi:hypothetical protein